MLKRESHEQTRGENLIITIHHLSCREREGKIAIMMLTIPWNGGCLRGIFKVKLAFV
jgi:hypothetical protein